MKRNPGKLLICCLALLGLNRARAGDLWNAGPLFDEFPLTLAPGHRTEIMGPLFYSEQRESQKTWAFPPLLSHTQDPDTDSEGYDFGYPVMTYHRFGSEYRWQLLQVLSFSGGKNPEDLHKRQFTIFPLYFQQRSPESNLNYTAVFPFYGTLKNRIFMDEIHFVMFPAYAEFQKGGVTTDNYLFPVFARRHGNGVHGWKVWPLAGHTHKVLTTQTNGWGEVEKIPGYDSRFVLWPFFLNQRSGLGTTNTGHQQALLPFYSYTRSPQEDSTTVLWPLITHVTNREKQYREWETPWPLIVFARGEGKTTSRVWPFFSQAQSTNLESDWYLWPVYKYNRIHVGALDRSRTRLLLFLYSDTVQKNTELGELRRRVDLWPLFTHQRDYNGNTRLQIFAPLEPILPYSPSIERDYSPLWSVWRSEHNPRTGARSQSLLWNLYRRDVTPKSTKWSCLFGLFQYKSSPGEKRLRLFYIPVMNERRPREAEKPAPRNGR